MSKKLLLLFITIFAVFGLASCETEVELTAIAFSGVADISVDNGSTFNVLEGVVALGNDEVDYSDQITLVTTSSAVNTTTGALDTLQAGVHFVRYEVRVGELVAQKSRNITVKAPVAVEGELVVNGDMASGIGGWNDAEVVYVADGATMTLTAEDGALKAEVVAGSNFFTPRFGQMNMAFETGKTYQVSFDAKSSVAKEIALQVGEIVGVAFGYYNDYLRKPEDILYRTITTEWTTYSYKFTVQNDQVLDIDEDGETGGIIFGLGKIGENSVNATMYFDNIVIEESTPDVDTTGPAISGAVDVEIKIGSTFNPLTGVQALDVTDGDVTANLVVVIKDGDGDIVSAVDTSAPGIFTVTYTVSDSLNNKSELVITVNVVDEIPEPEWIGYGVAVRGKAIVQYSGTTEAWWNNNAQLPLDEFDGTKATATFDFVGVKDQEYVFKIEGGGKFVETPFTATGDMQQAVLDLSGLTEAERNGLTLAVVFAKTLNGAGTLHLYTVLEAEVTSDWLFYGMTGQNVTTMEYPAPDVNAWWNNNAQLSILEFDGTKDTVLFNFVGAAGVKYAFKIEGGGKAVEVPVVATGEMQEHSLSLTGFTEAERAGLNLLIIFNMDATAVTSLDLYSVEYVTTVNYANSTVFTKSGFTTSYADGTFTDTNGLVWTFVHARDAGDFGFGENQDGIMLRRADEPSSLQVTLTSGLDDLSIEFKKAFTGGTPRTYEIHITNNGTTETYIIPAFGEGSGANDTIGTFTLSNLGLTGEVTVKIVAVGSNGNQQAVFNNFKWNANPTT